MRSLGFSPEPFPLTTGTFNLVVKDRTAFRLSGAYSVRTETLTRLRPSSKPYKVTDCARLLSTRCAHRISTGNAHAYRHVIPSRAQPLGGEHASRNPLFREKRATELISRWLKRTNFGTSRHGRFSIKKRSFGGSCDLRLNPSRSSVPECNSVAGVIRFFKRLLIDAGRAPRDSDKTPG